MTLGLQRKKNFVTAFNFKIIHLMLMGDFVKTKLIARINDIQAKKFYRYGLWSQS
jgi:hypothetical protein